MLFMLICAKYITNYSTFAFLQIFSVLFFFMLFVLGIGSVVAMQNVVATVFCDQFKTIAYWKVALVTSILGFLSGIVYLTPVRMSEILNAPLSIKLYFFTGRSMDIKFNWSFWRNTAYICPSHAWIDGNILYLWWATYLWSVWYKENIL